MNIAEIIRNGIPKVGEAYMSDNILYDCSLPTAQKYQVIGYGDCYGDLTIHVVMDNFKTLKIEKIESELKELELETSKQGFWDDSKNSQSVLSKISEYSGKIKEYAKLKNEFEEIEILIELSCQDDDTSSIDEINCGLKKFKKDFSF